MTFYSQKSYPNTKLGQCKDTISKSGCFITSIANLLHHGNNHGDWTPERINKLCMEIGAYSQGCLLNASVVARYFQMTYSKQANDPKTICIAETDHYKKVGVPQHFFLYNSLTKRRVDPLDTIPDWEENNYHVVSYRVFTPIKPVDKLKKEVESIIIAQEPQKTESDVQVPPKPTQTVESGNNQPTIDSMNDFKKRFYSFAWRAGMMALAVVLETAVQSLSGFGFSPEVTVIAGLVLGELSKQLRNNYVK